MSKTMLSRKVIVNIGISSLAGAFDANVGNAPPRERSWFERKTREQGLSVGRILHADPFPDEALAREIERALSSSGLHAFHTERHLYLARPRLLEIVAAINRLRNLRISDTSSAT